MNEGNGSRPKPAKITVSVDLLIPPDSPPALWLSAVVDDLIVRGAQPVSVWVDWGQAEIEVADD